MTDQPRPPADVRTMPPAEYQAAKRELLRNAGQKQRDDDAARSLARYLEKSNNRKAK